MPFYQAVKTGLNNRYYPQAVLIDKPFEIDDVAQELSLKSTVHKADIRAVLAALPEVLANLMAQGRSVHLEDLGYFRYVIDAKPGGKAAAAEVTADDIKQAKVIFRPETKIGQSGPATRALTPNSLRWVKWTGTTVADAAQSQTPATEQTGGDTEEENPYDPFAG